MSRYTSKYFVGIYKLLLVIVFFAYPFGNIRAFNPQKTHTTEYNEIALRRLLDLIEKEWDVVFVYNNVEINDKKIVSIEAKNADLTKTLDAFLPAFGISYRISEHYIFLKRNENQLPSKLSTAIHVNGLVTDDKAQALSGVYVLNKNGTLRAITDENGKFHFYGYKADSILTFQFLGYKSIEAELKPEMSIVLRNYSFVLNDLLVIGYGSIPQKEATGSIESMPDVALKNDVSGNVGSAFQGNVSGVYAASDRYRIRGVSSINSSSEPLLVVDGVPQSLTLKDLNPDDIQSVDFLKDAASAAIYGSRAANGVILVTTKSASFNSAFRVNINYKSGLNYTINQPQFLKGAQLLKRLDDAYYNRFPERKNLPDNDPLRFFPLSADYNEFQGFNRSWIDNYLTVNPKGTDWTTIVGQPMNFQDVRLSLQGGTDRNNFLLSFSFRNNKADIRDKKSDRVTVLFKNDYTFSDALKGGISVNTTVNSWYNSTFPTLTSVYSRSSLLPVYAPDGSGSLFDARNINNKKGTNPLYRITESWDDNIDMNAIMTAYLSIRFLKKFNFRTDWSFTPGTSRYRYFQSKDFYREDEAVDPSKSGMIQYARTLNYGFNVNNLLNFEHQFSKQQKMKIMLGNNIQSLNSDYNMAQYEGMPTDYFRLTNANTEKVYTRQAAGMDGYRFVSFFNRTQYNYADTWFAELNARVDGTSRFTPENRWGFFPGVGLSWLVSEESFMRNINLIDYLKLRTSYGYVGNAEVGNFPSESRVLNWAEYAGSPGFVFDRIANPDVQWEKQIQLNTGANLSVLQNRVMLSFDWYFKRSKDLLINYRIGSFQGYFNTEVTVNTGSLNNTGFDLSINTKNIDGKLKWQTDFNLASFRTKITKLSILQNFIEKGVNRVYEGYMMSLYYLPLWAGVDPETGHELIYEVAGPETNKQKTDRLLDAELLNNVDYRNQRVLLKNKSPYPDLYGGVNNRFTYKNWEFSFLFSFQFGNWVYNSGIRQNSYINTYDIQNKLNTLTNYWTPENKKSIVPLVLNSQMAGRESTRFLMDGSFVRLRNVYLSYALPTGLAKKLCATSVNFSLQAQNIATFTKFVQGDPEIASGAAGVESNLSPGVTGLNTGQAAVVFGITAGF